MDLGCGSRWSAGIHGNSRRSRGGASHRKNSSRAPPGACGGRRVHLGPLLLTLCGTSIAWSGALQRILGLIVLRDQGVADASHDPAPNGAWDLGVRVFIHAHRPEGYVVCGHLARAARLRHSALARGASGQLPFDPEEQALHAACRR